MTTSQRWDTSRHESEPHPEAIRILHVDDEPDVADLAATYLERNNEQFEVSTATSASEGQTLLEDQTFDCIVSDYDMPGTNGIEFLETVRECYPDLPFILYTGKGSEEVASDAISAGVTDYLQKGTGTEQYQLLANRITNAVEQYRTQQTLARQQSETERLRTLLTEAMAATDTYAWEWDLQTDTIDRYPTPEPVVGLTDDEFGDLFEDFLDQVHPDDSRAVERAYERVIEDGEDYRVECRLRSGDGSWRWIRDRGDVRTDETGTPVRAIGILTDITDQKRRERELERFRDLLTEAMAATETYVWEWDLQTDTIDRYPTPDPIFGLTNEEIDTMFESYPDPVHPDDRDRVVEAFEGVVERGDGYRIEYRNRVDDGPWRWVRDRGDVRTDASGTPVRAIGTVTDITDRKRRERELERRNDLFARAQDIADVGAWEYDIDTDDLIWTDQVYEIHDLALDFDPTPEKAIEFYHPDDRPRLREAFERALEESEPYDLELRLITAEDDQRWVRTRGDPQTRDGEIDCVRGTIQDVTDQKRREQDLQERNERLDDVLKIVSHDVRNPLSVARGQVELLQEEYSSEHLDAIERAHERIDGLLTDLRTRIREGDSAPDRTSVALADCLEECWRNVETADATLVTDTEQTVRADERMLSQLLENLIRNAVEHGGESVTVTVGDLDDGFFVADDGPGIPPSDREDVFEAGYSTIAGGTGFGLSIVEQVANAHGWEVRVTDGSTGGARFEFVGVESVSA